MGREDCPGFFLWLFHLFSKVFLLSWLFGTPLIVFSRSGQWDFGDCQRARGLRVIYSFLLFFPMSLPFPLPFSLTVFFFSILWSSCGFWVISHDPRFHLWSAFTLFRVFFSEVASFFPVGMDFFWTLELFNLFLLTELIGPDSFARLALLPQFSCQKTSHCLFLVIANVSSNMIVFACFRTSLLPFLCRCFFFLCIFSAEHLCPCAIFFLFYYLFEGIVFLMAY